MPNPAADRIDVHSHLLPGIDDGCATLDESLACARRLVEAGYTASFCTPHIWPNLPDNTPDRIVEHVRALQRALDAATIPLKLYPGAELNMRPELPQTPPELVPTYAMAGRYCLFDIWVEQVPRYFWSGVEWLQDQGLTVILAHPERMRAVQENPGLADEFARAGLLLQGNLQCFADPPHSPTRRVAEQYLTEDRYFMLGSDLHNVAGLRIRLEGLSRATQLAGASKIAQLTKVNPTMLLP